MKNLIKRLIIEWSMPAVVCGMYAILVIVDALVPDSGLGVLLSIYFEYVEWCIDFFDKWYR